MIIASNDQTVAFLSALLCCIIAVIVFFGSEECVQDCSVRYHIAFQIYMVCLGRRDRTGQCCILNGYIQRLFVVVDAVENITFVFAVFEGCVAVSHFTHGCLSVFRMIVDRIGCDTRVACIIGLYQLNQDTVFGTGGCTGEVHLAVIYDDV